MKKPTVTVLKDNAILRKYALCPELVGDLSNAVIGLLLAMANGALTKCRFCGEIVGTYDEQWIPFAVIEPGLECYCLDCAKMMGLL